MPAPPDSSRPARRLAVPCPTTALKCCVINEAHRAMRASLMPAVVRLVVLAPAKTTAGQLRAARPRRRRTLLSSRWRPSASPWVSCARARASCGSSAPAWLQLPLLGFRKAAGRRAAKGSSNSSSFPLMRSFRGGRARRRRRSALAGPPSSAGRTLSSPALLRLLRSRRATSPRRCAHMPLRADAREDIKRQPRHPLTVSATNWTLPAERAPCRQFGFVLFMWYFFNAVFAIFNKRTLNVFPYPWLLSWVQARGTGGLGCRADVTWSNETMLRCLTFARALSSARLRCCIHAGGLGTAHLPSAEGAAAVRTAHASARSRRWQNLDVCAARSNGCGTSESEAGGARCLAFPTARSAGA